MRPEPPSLGRACGAAGSYDDLHMKCNGSVFSCYTEISLVHKHSYLLTTLTPPFPRQCPSYGAASAAATAATILEKLHAIRRLIPTGLQIYES